MCACMCACTCLCVLVPADLPLTSFVTLIKLHSFSTTVSAAIRGRDVGCDVRSALQFCEMLSCQGFTLRPEVLALPTQPWLSQGKVSLYFCPAWKVPLLVDISVCLGGL